MKKRLYFLGGPAVAVTTTMVVVLAIQTRVQAQTATDTSGRLEEAVTLLDQGQPQAAQNVLATIGPSDPDYAEAKGYNALCLYQTDRLKFLNAMQSPEVQITNLPSQLREELTYDQIDSLFFYRQFEKLLPRLVDFTTRYTNSPLIHAVLEYQMATWYERGMKKIYEACVARDTNVFQQRYADGRSNLVDFLKLAVALNETNYQVLPKRVLKREIWKAQIALGEEKQAQDEVPYADQESEGFLSVKLHEKLQPQAADDNLRLMTNFLDEFPESKHRKRVLFDMADISFPKVEALYREARHAEYNEDTNAATSDRLEGQKYLQLTESLTNEFFVDKAAGIDASDVRDRQDDLLDGYYLEKDYTRILDIDRSDGHQFHAGRHNMAYGQNLSRHCLSVGRPTGFETVGY
jgi:hypothetical protein